jgi:hypothetical protein
MHNIGPQKLPRHHYIPVFYLKQWVGGDRRLCEFSRKWKDVKPRRTSPDGTGYVRGLYRLPNVPNDRADIVETKYMAQIDNDAAVALQLLLNPRQGLPDLTDKLKVHWARFLHCLTLRSPEYLNGIESLLKKRVDSPLEQYRADYEKQRKDTDPPTFDEFLVKFRANPLNTSAPRFIHHLIDNRAIITHLCQMPWNVVDFSNSPNLLLTSDRPIIMTNGLANPNGHIALPISPKQLFIAFSNSVGYQAVRRLPPKELIRRTNTLVVEQARDYVYGLSDASLSFVATRLGKRRPATPLEEGIFQITKE